MFLRSVLPESNYILDTHKNVMNKSLVSPCVMQGSCQIHVPIQNDKKRSRKAGAHKTHTITILLRY